MSQSVNRSSINQPFFKTILFKAIKFVGSLQGQKLRIIETKDYYRCLYMLDVLFSGFGMLLCYLMIPRRLSACMQAVVILRSTVLQLKFMFFI